MPLGTVLEDINPVGIDHEEIVPELAHPTFVHHSSSGRCQRYSSTVTDMLCDISHHVLPIERICNIILLVH